jgi:hypothetical protein
MGQSGMCAGPRGRWAHGTLERVLSELRLYLVALVRTRRFRASSRRADVATSRRKRHLVIFPKASVLRQFGIARRRHGLGELPPSGVDASAELREVAGSRPDLLVKCGHGGPCHG